MGLRPEGLRKREPSRLQRREVPQGTNTRRRSLRGKYAQSDSMGKPGEEEGGNGSRFPLSAPPGARPGTLPTTQSWNPEKRSFHGCGAQAPSPTAQPWNSGKGSLCHVKAWQVLGLRVSAEGVFLAT